MWLRAAAALLLFANLGFFAWSGGWLDGIGGIRSHPEREPERLTRQVNADIVRILPPMRAVAEAASAAPPAEVLCLQAGPFPAAEGAAAVAALQAAVPDLADHGYLELATMQPAVWGVFMGRYLGAELRQKRVDELRSKNIDVEVIEDVPDLSPGLVISRHDSEEAAKEMLPTFAQRGVRGAKVVQLRPPTPASVLRIAKADAALRQRLETLADPVFEKHKFERCDANKP